jgi:hypothetical protein
MAESSSFPDVPLLLLGRLDGRLYNSPAADIWTARMRLRGAVELATLAGLPVGMEALESWISGRTAPPRHGEGLNDPLSVAALFHFALSAEESARDPVARATLNMLRTLLDDRAEAEIWAPADLVRFGPVWRRAQALLTAPFAETGIRPLAERILAVRTALPVEIAGDEPLVTSIDGRQLRFAGPRFDINWIIACHLPAALEACGLTMRRLPSFVALPRFLPTEPGVLDGQLRAMIGAQAHRGLSELDRLERKVRAIAPALSVTRRSRAPLLMRLSLAYPGLSVAAAARLLGVSHQGATKLLRQVRNAAFPD